jgi:hypothetical protein
VSWNNVRESNRKIAITFSLSLSPLLYHTANKRIRERAEIAEGKRAEKLRKKNGRYNTKWQLSAFKYSHGPALARRWAAEEENEGKNKKKRKERIGKTTSNFLILKAVYVLFSRKPNCIASNVPGARKDGGWRRGKKRKEGKKIRTPRTSTKSSRTND